jgi:hypothetical protein
MSEAWLDTTIIQILMGNGIIDENKLKENLNFVSTDFSNIPLDISNLNLIFKRVNNKLRFYLFEVKTLIVKTDDGLQKLHGIANIEVSVWTKIIKIHVFKLYYLFIGRYHI